MGRQHDVLYLPPRGHAVVLGTAGSGKSLMAILRARYLGNANTENTGQVLVVTYNRALIAYLRALVPGGIPNVKVQTFGQFATGYLGPRGLLETNDIVSNRPYNALVDAALRSTSLAAATAGLDHEFSWWTDEFDWIAGSGFYNREAYIDPSRVERKGRGTGLRTPQREVVFDTFTAYRELRAARGHRYDWTDIASAVLAELNTDASPRRYRHVIIDECQDFSPEMLRAMVAATDPAGSLTIFGDYAQQIYGQRSSWRSVGLSVPNGTIQFKENYRNSVEVARIAIAMASLPYFPADADLVEPTAPRASGPKPAIVQCRDRNHEAEFVATNAKQLAVASRVAILYRDRGPEETAIEAHLGGVGTLLDRSMTTWSTAPGLWYGTYHAAKGLEFDNVLLPFCGESDLPAPYVVDAFGDERAMPREGRLLYVGITRARAGLVLTHSGAPTSLLPDDPELFVKQSTS